MKAAVVALGFAVAFASSAQAAIVELSLDESFNDGGSAHGRFTLNTDTNVVTNLNVLTTHGTSYSGATYTQAVVDDGVSCNGGQCAFDIPVDNTDGTAQLVTLIDDPLSLSGPTSIDTMNENSGEFTLGVIPGFEYRYVTSGNVTPVPEPATWSMLLVGLFGLGVILRRRRIEPCLVHDAAMATATG